MQVTNVAPNGNLPPLAGEHEELTGIVPPEIVGAAYVIVTAFPSGDDSDWLAGQLIPKDDGCEGELQAAATIARPAKTDRPIEHHETNGPPRPPWWSFCRSCASGALFKTDSHLTSQAAHVGRLRIEFRRAKHGRGLHGERHDAMRRGKSEGHVLHFVSEHRHRL